MTTHQNDIIIHSGDDDANRFHREEETGNIEPGTFWRCLEDVAGIDAKHGKYKHDFVLNEICLMTRLEFFDGKLHSVVLLSDPQCGTSSGLLTIPLFNKHFEWVPKAEAQKHRAEQIATIMGQTAKLQQEMQDAMANPELLSSVVDAGIKQWEIEEARRNARDDDEGDDEGSNPQNLPSVSKSANGRFDLSAAVTNKIGASDVAVFAHMAKRQGKVAEIRGEWLGNKVKEMTRVMEKLPPFYSEHANLGLAGAHEALTTAAEIQKGLRSLRLYTGEGVTVRTLMTGASASSDEPLTVFQRKLFMDEEFAVWTDIDHLFDYTKESEFFEALVDNPSLREQLLPANRGIVSMAIRRTDATYAVNNMAEAFQSMEKNKVNKALFLLVRDGENWYTVHSDEPSHEISPRLFPTRNEMGEIFQGVDGDTIGFEDLRFSHKTNEFDAKSLAYKRFLILAAGLDARLKLFGDFYPESLAANFISMGFQSKYMRFVSDDDSDVMLGDGLRSVHQLIRENQQGLAAGSRVMVFGKNVMEQEAAPGAFDKGRYDSKSYSTHYSQLVNPVDKFNILTVRLNKNDLVVDLPVERRHSHRRYSSQRITNTNFNVRVALNKLDIITSGVGYIVLETVTADMLRPYIYSRKSRASHVDYIYAFKLAVKVLEEREIDSAVSLDALKQIAKNTYNLNDDQADRASLSALQFWRQKNPDATYPPLPSDQRFNELAESLAEVAHAYRVAIPKVVASIEHLGGSVLRIMRGKRGSLIAYYSQPDSERDLRIHKWEWVGRRVFTANGKPTDEAPQTVALSDARIVGESELVRLFGDGTVDQTMASAAPEKVEKERLSLIGMLDTATTVTNALMTAFKGHREGISDEMWLMMTSGKDAVGDILRGNSSSFPIAVETTRRRMVTLRAQIKDLINWYGSDAQRAVLAGWIEAQQERSTQKPTKKKKTVETPIPHIFLDGGKSWSPKGLIEHDPSVFGCAHNISNHVNQKRTNINTSIARFLVSEETKVSSSFSDPFVDPKTTWFAPACFNEAGLIDVERFFPGYPPLQMAVDLDGDPEVEANDED